MGLKENKHKIYCYKNKVNGKRYIGRTKRSLDARAGKEGKHYRECTFFWNAIQKYGWNNFEREVLQDNLSQKEAEFWEPYYIQLFRTRDTRYGYNISKGGKTINDREAHKMANDKSTSRINEYNSRKVGQKDTNGKTIKVWNSIAEVEKFLGLTSSQVYHAFKRGKGSFEKGGYLWIKRGYSSEESQQGHEETYKRMAERLRGRSLDKETATKISRALKERGDMGTYTDVNKLKLMSSVKVEQRTKEGKIVKIWPSIASFACEEATNFSVYTIRRRFNTNNEQFEANGFLWIKKDTRAPNTIQRKKEAGIRHREVMKERTLSEETRRKISEAQRGEKNWNYKGTISKCLLEKSRKEIIQKDLKGNTIKVWESIRDADEYLGYADGYLSTKFYRQKKNEIEVKGYLWEKKEK